MTAGCTKGQKDSVYPNLFADFVLLISTIKQESMSLQHFTRLSGIETRSELDRARCCSMASVARPLTEEKS